MSNRSFYGTHKMVFLLQMIAEATAVNLYADKTAFYCFTRITSKKIFDGIKNKHNMEIFNEACPSTAFIQISLNGMFSINYVIVFEGYGNTQEQMDFFVVQRNSAKDSDACGEYPGKGQSKTLQGLRVNCKTVVNLHTTVTITSLKNRGFYISEIELHSFGSGLANENILIYRGCFLAFGTDQVDLDFQSCQNKCLTGGFQFAGIRENKICACDNNIDPNTEVSYVECNMKCDGGRKECGGPKSYSVYLVKAPLPFFVGCFKSSDSNSTTTAGEMTIAKCLRACDSYKYAMLQNGSVCICRDDVIKHDIVATSMCAVKCIGDPNFYCGGRNLDSVYSTCYQDDQEGSIKCSELLNCADSYNAFGSCDVCKVGFLGEYCLERAKFFKPGEVENVSFLCEFSNPCLEIRNSYCTVTAENVLCECLVGYTKNKDERDCEDIDECMFEPCDIRTSSCVNLNGSYACKCKTGSIMVTDDVCVVNSTKAFDYGATLEYYMRKSLTIVLPLVSLIILLLVVRYEAPWIGSETMDTTDASMYAIDGSLKFGDANPQVAMKK